MVKWLGDIPRLAPDDKGCTLTDLKRAAEVAKRAAIKAGRWKHDTSDKEE